jgi:hypothetical protein
MARSPSESRIPASSPPPLAESLPAPPPGSPGIAAAGTYDADVRQGAGSMVLPWAAAFTLGACAVLAFVASVVAGPGRGWPGAGAVAAALLLATLAVLRQRYSGLDDDVARAERRAAQWQQYAEELERRADEQQARYSGTVSAVTEAVNRLVRVQLPAALNGSVVPQSAPDAAGGAPAEVLALCDRAAGTVAERAAGLREQLDGQIESYRLAVVTLARRVQASAHRIQEQATRMANRHPGNSDVLESSMLVDHAAAQQARHAQSVAVLGGEWPGQQWPQPLALLDVVRAAAGRIVAYRRITVSGEPDVAATASAVEPLIHLVAELLANATQSSPPTTQVLVTVRAVQRGAVIEMDDGGVGLEEHQLEQAREIISGRRLLGLGDLGEVPQTGMAVVGQYVRRHGFRVDLMPSPYGGVRAIVLVSAEMVENLEPAALPEPAPLPARGSVPSTRAAGLGSLPQRRSRRDESASAVPNVSAPAEPAPPAETPQQAGAWLAAYFGTGPESTVADDTAVGGSTSEAPKRADPLGGGSSSGSNSPGNQQA